AAVAQITGCSVQQNFSSSLVGTSLISGSPTGFANASLLFDTSNNTATLTSSTLGLNNITGISLYQGAPGSSGAQLVRSFTTIDNNFVNGQFTGTATVDPLLMSHMMVNKKKYFYDITTTDFPQDACYIQ